MKKISILIISILLGMCVINNITAMDEQQELARAIAFSLQDDRHTTEAEELAMALHLSLETNGGDEALARMLQEEDQINGDQITSDLALALSMQEKENKAPKGKAQNQKPAAKKPTPRNQRPAPRTAPTAKPAPRPTPVRKPAPRPAQRPSQPAKPSQPKPPAQQPGTIALPQELISQNIVQLQSKPQGANQCGYFATYNAHAIQRLVTEGKWITADAVKAYVPNISQIPKQQLYAHEVNELANRTGLKRTLILAYNRKSDQIYIAGGTEDIGHIAHSDVNTEQSFNLFFGEARYLGPDMHFICNTSGHWVAVSAINENGIIHLYYLNSSNAPIFLDCLAFKFLTFIRNMIDISPTL